MTDKEIKQWTLLYKQVKNGYHMEKNDWRELVRLNHLIMEASHDIHNKNMLSDTPNGVSDQQMVTAGYQKI